MDTPPTKYGDIPVGIVEEILWNLPVKSLLRFSSVSKSWNLTINEPRFSKKYRGRERLILRIPYSGGFRSCPLSAAVSNNPIEEETHLDVFKFDGHINDLSIRAVCDGLCCLESRMSPSLLFIWNPSNQKFHKLPRDPFPTAQRWPAEYCNVYNGLGYDSVGDDYKLVRILGDEAALYSLRSDSWRKIESFPKTDRWLWWLSCSVSGAIHWLCYDHRQMSDIIVSFDLSKEEYGELALPPEYISPNLEFLEFDGGEFDRGEVAVLRGKLCLSRRNYRKECRFVLWVMEDYGVAESWTKKFDIDYDLFGSGDLCLRLLCSTCDDDDDGGGPEAICVTSFGGESWVVLKNKLNGNTLVKKNKNNFGKEVDYRNYGFVYVESLVSPAALATPITRE